MSEVTESKATIKARNGKDVKVVTVVHPQSVGVAYIAHGFGGWLTEPTVVSIHQALYVCGYTTVRWNVSESRVWRTSASGFYRDCEDVIAWGRTQEWGRQRIVIAGHSLGGMIAGSYAINNVNSLYAAVLVAPAVSERALRNALLSEDFTTWLQRNLPPVLRRNRILFEIVVSYISRDLKKHSLMRVDDGYTLPTLIVGGGLDDIVLPLSLHRFREKLRAPHQELKIVPGLSHTIHPYDLPQISKVIADFVAQLN